MNSLKITVSQVICIRKVRNNTFRSYAICAMYIISHSQLMNPRTTSRPHVKIDLNKKYSEQRSSNFTTKFDTLTLLWNDFRSKFTEN